MCTGFENGKQICKQKWLKPIKLFACTRASAHSLQRHFSARNEFFQAVKCYVEAFGFRVDFKHQTKLKLTSQKAVDAT